MMEQYARMKEGFDVLNNIKFSPSGSSTDRIMAYAALNGFSMQ
jgi:hypothetical protein